MEIRREFLAEDVDDFTRYSRHELQHPADTANLCASYSEQHTEAAFWSIMLFMIQRREEENTPIRAAATTE